MSSDTLVLVSWIIAFGIKEGADIVHVLLVSTVNRDGIAKTKSRLHCIPTKATGGESLNKQKKWE